MKAETVSHVHQYDIVSVVATLRKWLCDRHAKRMQSPTVTVRRVPGNE